MMRPNSKTQSDTGLGFDGAAVETTRKPAGNFHKNQWSGHLNDGRDVNMGRGPTKGNDGSCHHAGYSHAGKTPPTSALPAVPPQGSVRDNINRGSQVRGGGKDVKKPANPDRQNVGRGPTKGNQQ